MQNRRHFLGAGLSMAGLAAFTGSANLVGARRSIAIEAAPETTSVHLEKDVGVCIAPQYVVEDLCRWILRVRE
jgi:NitT/TauT family transport system substrate-binding protein